MPSSIAYVGDARPSGRKVGDVVLAAANPNALQYVAANGALLNSSSYPALLTYAQAVGWPYYPYRVDNAVTTAPTSPGSYPRMRKMNDAAGTLVMLGIGTNGLPIATISADGGMTWSAVPTMPTQAQLDATSGEGTIAPNQTSPTPDVFYDPVSQNYILATGYSYNASGSNWFFVSLFYSSSLTSPVWTPCSNTASTHPYNGFLAGATQNNGAISVATNGSATIVQAGGLGLFTCPSGSDASKLVNWTTPATASGIPMAMADGTFFCSTGGSTTYYTSPDAVTWTSHTAPNTVTAMYYLTASATYVIVTNVSGVNGYLYSSTSAAGSWTSIPSPASGWTFGTFGAGAPYGGLNFFCDGSAIIGLLASTPSSGPDSWTASLDGLNWTPVVSPPVSNLNYMAMFNGKVFHWYTGGFSYVAKTPYLIPTPNYGAPPDTSFSPFFKVA